MMLPDSFGMLKNLKNLDLVDCGFKYLPKSFGELNNLKGLKLYGCEELMMLPNSFWNAQKFEEFAFTIFWNQEFARVLWRAKQLGKIGFILL